MMVLQGTVIVIISQQLAYLSRMGAPRPVQVFQHLDKNLQSSRQVGTLSFLLLLLQAPKEQPPVRGRTKAFRSQAQRTREMFWLIRVRLVPGTDDADDP